MNARRLVIIRSSRAASRAGVGPAQRLDFLDELWNAGHGVFRTFVFSGQVAVVPALGKDLPDAVKVQRLPGFTVEIADVSVGGVGEAKFDLFVRILRKIADVQVAPRIR